jgi:hypothetical protein
MAVAIEVLVHAWLNHFELDEKIYCCIICRYGYTEDSHKRIQDIDRELADIQSKSLPLGSHISEEVSSSIYSLCDEDLRNSMGNETRFPPLPGEGLRSSAQKEDADINSPDKKVRKEKKENILQKQVRNVDDMFESLCLCRPFIFDIYFVNDVLR